VIAVGPTDIVETVNTAAAVYSKSSGAQLAEFDFASFWNGSGRESCVDPRALYLSTVNRFAIACTDNTTPTSPMRFAISETSDPTGAWFRYAAPNTSFLDQEKIVATSDKFIIAGNTGSNEQMYIYNLSDVVAGLANPTVVHKIALRSNVYEAAVEQTAASPAYFVSSFPGESLWLATITGTPAANNVKLTERKVSSADFPAPQEPSVPGGQIGGGDLDGRVYDAIYEVETSDSHPVIQYSSARECGTRDCLTSARIDLSKAAPTLIYDHLVGEPGFDYTYGAAGLDGAGNVYEAYTRTTPGAAPTAAVIGPTFDVVLQPPGAGTTSCSSGQSPACDERWGDYVGTAIDPSDLTTVWVAGLYQATSGGFGWGTVIQKINPATYALPTATTGAASALKANSANVSVTVNPNGASTSIHADYGLTTGYDSATTPIAIGNGTSPVTKSISLTGLQPGTKYHYRVVATTSVGNAIGADKALMTPAPKITAVTFTGTGANPTVKLTGTNFGATPPSGTAIGCGSGDTGDDYGSTGLWFSDSTQGWTAGQAGDCIGLIIQTWSTTSVVFTFGNEYPGYPQITNGDSYTVQAEAKSFSATVSGLS
jgi:hypothetical protein